MMYPRLKLARNLLTDDGVIFIQIDDKEYENLLKIVKEIFGEENFINTICVNMSNLSGPKINNAILGKKFPKIKEYLLLFCKNKEKYKLIIPKQKKEKWDPEYNLIIPELTKEEKSNLHSFSVEDLNLQFSKYTLESLNEFMKKIRLILQMMNGNLKIPIEYVHLNRIQVFYQKQITWNLKVNYIF